MSDSRKPNLIGRLPGGMGFDPGPAPVQEPPPPLPQYMPGQLVVQLKDDAVGQVDTAGLLDSLQRRHGLARMKPGDVGRSQLSLQIRDTRQMTDAIRNAEQTPGVDFAEPVPYMWAPEFEVRSKPQIEAMVASWKANPIISPDGSSAIPVNPGDVGRWARDFVNRPIGWDGLKLENIAVLDSGCDPTHPALAGRIDFADPISGADRVGHGTFVCGSIAAKYTTVAAGLDDKVVSDTPDGLLPSSRLWVANVFTKAVKIGGVVRYHIDPPRYWGFLKAIADAKKSGKGRLSKIEVLSLSLGTAAASKTEKAHIAALIKAGVTVVAATGNQPSGFKTMPPMMYPAAYPGVIAVGALGFSKTRHAIRWQRSLWELPEDSLRDSGVDVYAPGDLVLSAWPMAKGANVQFSAYLSGTSMAAPFVAAVVAVLRSQGISDRDKILTRLQQPNVFVEDAPALKWR